MKIRFIKYCPPYVVGDVATKSDPEARNLIGLGVAKLFVDPAIEELAKSARPSAKPKSEEPAAPKPRRRRAKKVSSRRKAKVADDE
jgi:hypothetical protein